MKNELSLGEFQILKGLIKSGENSIKFKGGKVFEKEDLLNKSSNIL